MQRHGVTVTARSTFPTDPRVAPPWLMQGSQGQAAEPTTTARLRPPPAQRHKAVYHLVILQTPAPVFTQSSCKVRPCFLFHTLISLIMGTLTADCPRLDIHCPHKLATSCRLTSTPNCCACADERVHSRTYRVYIDGVGFVNRGTRWQGYCWFCKGMGDSIAFKHMS